MFNISLALLIAIFSYTPSALAANKCSNLFKRYKPAAITPVKEIDLTKVPGYEDLMREYPDLKPVAGYDKTGTVTLHTSALSLDGWKYFRDFLLRFLPQDIKTLLVGTKNDYDSFVNYQFKHHARKGDLDRFLEVQNEVNPPGNASPDARWLGDQLGFFVTYTGRDGIPVTAMVTSNYRFNYKISQQLAKHFGIQIIHTIRGLHEWGNFTVIGDTVYLIDGPRTGPDLKLEDFMYTGAKKLVLLPQPVINGEKQGIPHTDEFLIPLSKDHIVTNIPEYAEYFKKQGKKVALLPNNGDLALADFPLSHLTYANAVLVKGESESVLFVPQFGNLKPEDNLFGEHLTPAMIATLKQRDRAALRVYQNMAKELNIKVIAVDVSQFIFYNFGGLHCASGICAAMPTAEKPPGWYNSGDGPL
jgi:hypothetical protein